MRKTFNQFAQVAERPYDTVAAWKKSTGKKVVGCLPMYVPEEIVHAGGMLPVIVFGSDEPISYAERYLQPYICAMVRSSLDMLLKGGWDFLDAVIFPDICDALTCISDIWCKHKPDMPSHTILLPKTVRSPSSQSFLQRELQRLKSTVENWSGTRITNTALRHSISVYNRQRTLLQRLYQLRRDNPGLLSPEEMAAVVGAGMFMPKEEHSQMVESLLKELKGSRVVSKDGVRIVLAGNVCEEPSFPLLRLVEESGAVVADDDLYSGFRYFSSLTPREGDPLQNLVKRHAYDIPCATKHNPPPRIGDYLVDTAKKSQAQGVIVLAPKYCDPLLLNYPNIRNRLMEADIPHLLLETEQGGVPIGPFRTRIQAFVEALGEKS